jgi:hypothetical protein
LSPSEWALLYLLVGAVASVALMRDSLEDVLFVIGVIVLFPLLPFALVYRKVNAMKFERKRQSSITSRVASGEYTEKEAYDMRWKGPKR